MTEEEYFRKNYPDSCYGDKPLSPHWDFFQDGVEFGERQSEKRIEELEQVIKTQDRKLRQQSKVCDKAINRVETLVKENTDLQKSYEELYNSMRMIKDQRNELEKENESLENVKNIYIGDLLKAREIILKLYNAGRDVLMCRAEEKAYNNLDEAINDKSIEQFLKEVEK